MKGLKIQVSGRVQGVWFRANTQRKAKEIGVLGIVKNLPNGNVYIEAEGTNEALEKFVEWCHKGSELSKVESVEIEEIEIQNFDDFKIVRS